MMAKNKKDIKKEELDNVVTLSVLFEFTDQVLIPRMADLMDIKIDEKFDGFEKKVDKKFEGFEKKMDKKFEGFEKKMNKKFANHEYNMKTYIDEKLADYTSEIFSRLAKKEKKESDFRKTVVNILKKHNIGTEKELAYLKGLAEAI